jgi:DNA-binding transcriptional LysR family regulator
MTVNASRDTQLRMFVAVAKASSLRVAADGIGITQPALSKHIHALEQSLGKQLFRRHGRGMQITPDGQALFLKIEPLFDALDVTYAQSLGQGSRHGASLRIAAVQTLVAYFIPELSRDLLSIYPKAHLNIHCDSSANVVESVERGMADVGFVYDTAVDAAELVSITLFEERLALYASVANELSADMLSNLSALKLILPPKQFAVRRMVERALGSTVLPFIECDSLELCLRLVSLSDGVTVLPEGMPRDMVEDRGLCRYPLPAIAPRRLVALSRIKRGQSGILDAAIEIAQRTGPWEP